MTITPEQLAKPNTEDAHQQALFAAVALEMQFGRYNDLCWLHHIPNGDQTAERGAKMRAMGLKRGVWDISLPLRRGHFAGLIIEMKKPGRQTEKNGGLSDDQVRYGQFMQMQGFMCSVCYSWQEALQIIKWYYDYAGP